MTAPSPEQVKAIVAGLNKAQAAFLLRDANTPMDDGARDKPGIARQLHDLGLTFIDLSPLGYQVRAHMRRAALQSKDQ